MNFQAFRKSLLLRRLRLWSREYLDRTNLLISCERNLSLRLTNGWSLLWLRLKMLDCAVKKIIFEQILFWISCEKRTYLIRYIKRLILFSPLVGEINSTTSRVEPHGWNVQLTYRVGCLGQSESISHSLIDWLGTQKVFLCFDCLPAIIADRKHNKF